jgi:endonuclease/exonuclease/phosphatase family metal-dependent hydrolase
MKSRTAHAPGGAAALSKASDESKSGSASRADVLRVATYNIHKGVRGMGPRRRLEIHNLAVGIEALGADLVFLQEVRGTNRAEALQFPDTRIGWPRVPQADYVAPDGYEVAYRSNAVTRHGDHGNALLSRWPIGDVGHHDVSDHPFEQRGLLHVPVQWSGRILHAIVVHLGLIHASRVRQVARIAGFIAAHVPAGDPVVLAGDFNDWGERLDASMHAMGLEPARVGTQRAARTFPSRAPVFALDRVYIRGLRCNSVHVPRGASWARMSDHLPLVVELCAA